MSDFDKEAERQKLREKFDRDKQKRKETERMSQLLLQGATMTNRHCDSCGDPLFRYQGQTFCATCEGNAQEQAETEPTAQPRAVDARAEGESDGESETTPEAASSAEATAADTPQATDVDAAGHPRSRTATEAEDDQPARQATHENATPTAQETDVETIERSQPRATTAAGVDQSAEGDLDAARASLVRTLTQHAQRAEAVDDPRRATDHLTAVREAAEALAALDGNR